jgi:uncharacterized protein YllA (UPF0747 family)
VVPRPSVTLLDDKLRRTLDRIGVDVDSLRRPFRDVVADAVAEDMPREVIDALAAIRASITDGYDDLAAAATRIDPTLLGPLIGARNASLLDTNAAERRIAARLQRRNHVRIEQLRRATAHIQPLNAPQERIFGPLPFVAAVGRGIIADIEAALDMGLTSAASWAGPLCD